MKVGCINNILLISDEDLWVDFVHHNCKRVFGSSFQLDYASKGSEAIDFLFDRNYDLILLDNNLASTITEKFLVLYLKAFSGDALLVTLFNKAHKDCLNAPTLMGVDQTIEKDNLEAFLVTFCERHNKNMYGNQRLFRA